MCPLNANINKNDIMQQEQLSHINRVRSMYNKENRVFIGRYLKYALTMDKYLKFME